MLEAIDLTKDFGSTRALEALSLWVAPGEVFCLLGANGAGKTTTINLFLGFVSPTSGSVRVAGIDVANSVQSARARMLYIPEQVALYGELTGLENLAYFATLAGVRNVQSSRLKAALVEAGLSDGAHDRRAGTYSKGMRQKVGIALAIAKNADALLLDEPTSGLDPKASAEFHELTIRQRDRGAAILMATHDIFRAREVGTRIGVMRDGRLRRVVDCASLSATELEALYLEEMEPEHPRQLQVG